MGPNTSESHVFVSAHYTLICMWICVCVRAPHENTAPSWELCCYVSFSFNLNNRYAGPGSQRERSICTVTSSFIFFLFPFLDMKIMFSGTHVCIMPFYAYSLNVVYFNSRISSWEHVITQRALLYLSRNPNLNIKKIFFVLVQKVSTNKHKAVFAHACARVFPSYRSKRIKYKCVYFRLFFASIVSVHSCCLLATIRFVKHNIYVNIIYLLLNTAHWSAYYELKRESESGHYLAYILLWFSAS